MKINWLRWKVARGFHAFDSLVLDYKSEKFSSMVYKMYPPGYVKECPWWAMQ